MKCATPERMSADFEAIASSAVHLLTSVAETYHQNACGHDAG